MASLLPCFYILELEGAAANALLPLGAGVKKISVASLDFSCDIQAQAALDGIISSIAKECEVDNAKEAKFNPEFYPSLPPLVLSDEQKDELIALNNIVAEAQDGLEQNQIAIPISKIFDDAGDFVVSRTVLTFPSGGIVGKVAVSPELYIDEKHKAVEAQHSYFNTRALPPKQHIH